MERGIPGNTTIYLPTLDGQCHEIDHFAVMKLDQPLDRPGGRKEEKEDRRKISVFAPGVLTLDATIDLRLGFIRSPGLPQHPERFVVPARRAFDLRLWKGRYVRFDDHHLLRGLTDRYAFPLLIVTFYLMIAFLAR
jgi:hypothetical protein